MVPIFYKRSLLHTLTPVWKVFTISQKRKELKEGGEKSVLDVLFLEIIPVAIFSTYGVVLGLTSGLRIRIWKGIHFQGHFKKAA